MLNWCKGLLNNFLKVLLVFVILFNSMPVSAATNDYNHSELLEYNGYGEAMYEAVVRETTFLTGHYTNNKDYVSQSIDKIVDYANFWKDEYTNVYDSCNGGYKECLRNMLETGTGYLMTVGDWVKKLFNDYEVEEKVSNPSSPLDQSIMVTTTLQLYAMNGYEVTLSNNGVMKVINSGSNTIISWSCAGSITLDGNCSVKPFDTNPVFLTKDERSKMVAALTRLKTSQYFSDLVEYMNYFKVSVTVKKDGSPIDVTFPVGDMNNYLKDNVRNITVPKIKPVLVCVNGESINLTISGSTFLNGTEVVAVNKDGTSAIGDTTCDLKWQQPNIDEIEGRPAIQDLDGDWIDIETGENITGDSDIPDDETGDVICTEDGQVISCEKIEKPDTSLLVYIRNAYEYATTTLKVAVDGIKSLNAGSEALVDIYKHYMGWLPTSVSTLLYSGLGIMIALRIFRK